MAAVDGDGDGLAGGTAGGGLDGAPCHHADGVAAVAVAGAHVADRAGLLGGRCRGRRGDLGDGAAAEPGDLDDRRRHGGERHAHGGDGAVVGRASPTRPHPTTAISIARRYSRRR